jgi:PKD repeat protein
LYTDTNTYTVKLYAYGTFFADSMVKTNYIKIVNNLYSELKNFSIFSITPIPANEEIFIHSSTPVNDDFIIYNIEGKPVKSGKITTIQNKINVSNLSAGWYCIKLLNQEQKLTFIKN